MATATKSGVPACIRNAFRMDPNDYLYVEEVVGKLEAFSEYERIEICLALLEGAGLDRPMSKLVAAVRELDIRRSVRVAQGANPVVTDEEIAEAFAPYGIAAIAGSTPIF